MGMHTCTWAANSTSPQPEHWEHSRALGQQLCCGRSASKVSAVAYPYSCAGNCTCPRWACTAFTMPAGRSCAENPSKTVGSQTGPEHRKARAATPHYTIFLAINYHGEGLAPNSVLGLIHYPEEQSTSWAEEMFPRLQQGGSTAKHPPVPVIPATSLHWNLHFLSNCKISGPEIVTQW